VFLYTVDDLQEVIRDGLRSRQEAAAQAEEIIDHQVSHFLGWLRSQEAVDSICAYRDHAAATREEVLARARRLLARGEDPDAALQYLAHTLTNKLTHRPSVKLRQACFEGREDVITAAGELLGVPPPRRRS
jgi:glutamyl-tRNA reductase